MRHVRGLLTLRPSRVYLAPTDNPGGAADTAFRGYTGTVTAKKLPRLHSMACAALSTPMFLFRRDRKRVIVDQLHLPPGN